MGTQPVGTIRYAPDDRPRTGALDDAAARRIGHVLRVARRRHGWSQRVAASMVGCTQVWIGMIERGAEVPSLRSLYRIAAAYGVQPSEILRAAEELT